MESRFNEKRLLRELSNMERHQQLAFGAGCCERMLPNYESFVEDANWGDVAVLRRALDLVWQACEGTELGKVELRQTLAQCERYAPDSEDFTSVYTSLAQDAVFSICALIDFLLDGDLSSVVSVPRFSTDSVDLFVQEQERMDPTDPSREQKILEHPLMQQELLREQRDLAEARSISVADGAALLAFRSRAGGESNLALAS